MANGEKITAKGASDVAYDFWVYPWGTQLQAVGGVYLVLKKPPNANYNVLYVGQTGDLSERFDNHHKEGCFARNGRTHIGARAENSEQRRLAIEADLTANYRPTCNG
jgi:hypothetical protein